MAFGAPARLTALTAAGINLGLGLLTFVLYDSNSTEPFQFTE